MESCGLSLSYISSLSHVNPTCRRRISLLIISEYKTNPSRTELGVREDGDAILPTAESAGTR